MTHPENAGSRLVAEIADAERAERTRLAERLHDEGLQLVLAARQDVAELRAGDAAALDLLEENLEQIVATLRSLTSSMHEDILDVLPLGEALERIGLDTSRRGRFTIAIDVDAAASSVHDALVRDLARELLANVARHARARHVEVTARLVADTLTLRVADDGDGFDVLRRLEATRAGHVGLGRIERIASELGGGLAVESEGDAGTTATVWLPVAALAAQGSLEEALRGERRWTAAMLAALQEGLLVFREGKTIQVNDAFCRMTGFTRTELIGTTPENYPFWPEADREELKLTVVRARTDPALEEELDFRRASGERFPVACSSARIDDPAAGEVAMLVTVTDLTERRRAEERRRLELELGTTIETTHKLTDMVTAVGAGTPALLDALGRLLVEHLGWADAVINLREPGTDVWRVAWTSSAALAADLPGDDVAGARWAPYLEARFEQRGAYFLATGAITEDEMPVHIPEWTPGAGADAWQPADMLLVPMQTPDGALLGVASVDRPRSGRRPTDTELDALVAVARHAAGTLALARQLAG